MKRFLKYGLHVAVLLGLIIAAVKYVSGEEFLAAIEQFDWWYAPLIFGLTALYLLARSWRFKVLLRPLTDIGRWMIVRAYVAGQAATLVPGGVTARAAILKQVGVDVPKSGAAIALSSLFDQVLFMTISILAALWFEPARQPVLILLAVLTVVSVLLGIAATRTWLLGVIDWFMGRVRLLEPWKRFLAALQEALTLRVILNSLGLTLTGFALMVIALDISLRGIGAAVAYPTLLLAFVLPTMLGRISALPGGVGVTEAAMVGILSATPEVNAGQAAAAVAIFRVGTVLFAALLGGLMYFLGWRGEAEVAAAEPLLGHDS